MKKIFYSLVLGLILSSFNLNYSYCQKQLGLSQILMLETARFDIFELQDMYEDTNFRLAMERIFNMFVLRDNTPDKKTYFRSALEHRMILKGKSTRIKFLFDNQKITHIEVEGVGKTTPEDIKNGQFIATLQPEKTTLFKVNVHIKAPDGTTKVYNGLCNTRVIVVDDKKEYRKARERISMLETDAQYTEADNIISKLAGEIPEK